MEVEVPLTLPQQDFVFNKNHRPAICGGLGSGKSRAGTFRIVNLLIGDKGINCAYYMPTYDLIKLRGMPGVIEDLTMIGLSYTVNQSDYKITVHGYGFIIFRSYDRPERIIAYEVAHSIVDELDTLAKEKAALVWRKISERNRQVCSAENSIGLVTTPDQGISGFVYEKWMKIAAAGYVVIKAPTDSNPFLPAGYIDSIRENYDTLLADMYISGEFVSLNQNKIYHFFSRETHHTDRDIQPSDKLYIGLDFNVGGCCAVVFVIDGKDPVAVDEFVSHDTHDFCNNLTRYDGHNITVYPDASGDSRSTNAVATDLEIINNAGFAVDAPNGNPFVRDRINAKNALLSHSRLKVNCSKCPEYATALETQGYDKKGDPEKFNEHPAIDDWNDGAGYFIHRRFEIRAPSHAIPMGR